MPKWVKLREGKGLPKRHGIDRQDGHGVTVLKDGSEWPQHYQLKAGHWLPDVDDATAKYLDEQYVNGQKLVVLADNEKHAAEIAMEEARQGEPAVEIGTLPKTLTNDDLMRRATMRAADSKPLSEAEPAPAPSAEPPVEEVYTRIGAVVGGRISDAIRAEYGDGIVDVLADDPERLTEIDGVGANRLKKMVEAVRDVL